MGPVAPLSVSGRRMTTLAPLLLSVALLAPAAQAQDPSPTELAAATPGELVAGDSATTTMYVQAPAQLRRTPAEDGVKVGDVAQNDKVTLVLADGDWYRVMKGTNIGWLQAGEVSMVPPAGSLGTLDLGALGLGGGGLQLGAPPQAAPPAGE